MDSLPEQILVDILTEEMDMPPNSVWVRDQNRLIPNDDGLYIIIGMVDSKPMSNTTTMIQNNALVQGTQNYFSDDVQTKSYFSDDDETVRYVSDGGTPAQQNVDYFSDRQFTKIYFSDDAQTLRYISGSQPEIDQVQLSTVQTCDNIMISILSRDTQALTRRWEIIAALQSIYSQQQQEANSFKIFRLPLNFVNASSAEGGSNINRFSITVPCFVWYKKEKVLTATGGDYYDDFTTRVDDEKTIGTPKPLFEFEITGDTIK